MMGRTQRFSRTREVVAAAAIAALLVGVGAAAQAAPAPESPHPEDDTAVIVDLGNRITATVDSDSGQVRVTTPTPLIWDPNLTNADFPRGPGLNRFGFGVGWNFAAPGWPGGTRFIEAEGGATMYFPDLGQSYKLDASTETGLSGYPRNDVRVTNYGDGDHPVLAPRRDVPARQYRFTLLQLKPNILEYYGWFGDLIATVNLTTGDRWDWVYDWEGDEIGDDDHNLIRVVDQNGGNFLRIDQPNRREWFEFHTIDGRITQVFVENSHDKISRIITGTGQTHFDFPNDNGLPWFSNVETPLDNGFKLEVKFTWDRARPGSVTRVERCDAGTCNDVFPVP